MSNYVQKCFLVFLSVFILLPIGAMEPDKTPPKFFWDRDPEISLKEISIEQIAQRKEINNCIEKEELEN